MKFANMRKSLKSLVAVCLAASLSVGCQKFDMTKAIPWGNGEDGELQRPMKVVAVWTDTVLSQGMAPSTRGFGGRIMFYAVEGGKPVKARGTLTVYAFDETGRDVAASKPDRKYVFTPEQFEKHYSKSALGHSYSVWLPWDGAGGPFREISLMVRFQPDNGPAVIGEPAKQHLPGVRAEEQAKPVAAAAQQNSSNIQQVGYEQPSGPATNSAEPQNPTNTRRMTTTTIALPTTPQSRRTSALAQSLQSPQQTQAHTTIPPTQLPTTMWQQQHGAAATGSPQAGHQSQAVQQPATQQPAQPAPQQSSGHYGPQRLRPLGSPIARLTRDHAPWQPPRIEPPSDQPSSPQ